MFQFACAFHIRQTFQLRYQLLSLDVLNLGTMWTSLSLNTGLSKMAGREKGSLGLGGYKIPQNSENILDGGLNGMKR